MNTNPKYRIKYKSIRQSGETQNEAKTLAYKSSKNAKNFRNSIQSARAQYNKIYAYILESENNRERREKEERETSVREERKKPRPDWPATDHRPEGATGQEGGVIQGGTSLAWGRIREKEVAGDFGG